jgi:hypothetical protein
MSTSVQTFLLLITNAVQTFSIETKQLKARLGWQPTAGRCVYHGVQSWERACGWRKKEGLVAAMPGQLTSSDPSWMNVPHCHGLIDPNEAKWWTARSALQMSVHRTKRGGSLERQLNAQLPVTHLHPDLHWAPSHRHTNDLISNVKGEARLG